MEGTTFGDVPLNLEMKLEVWDSPNSAGIVIDAVRCAKLALDHQMKGALVAPSSYFKKSPPIQIPDDTARELVEQYIKDPKGTEKMLREKGAPTVRREAAPLRRGAATRPAFSKNGAPNGKPATTPAVAGRGRSTTRRKARAR
jgi:myo-inositol-1-phosphate synthase